MLGTNSMPRQTLLGLPQGRRMRRSDDALLRVQASLTNRDMILLDWLYDHAVLTTDQIATALFPSLDFAHRRLLRLTRLGVVDRFRPQRWRAAPIRITTYSASSATKSWPGSGWRICPAVITLAVAGRT